MLRFWNVKSYGECVWEQHAGHAPGEAVVALATDAKNTMLFSGDSAGLVKVWGIANFVNVAGVEQSNNVKELHHWRAHERGLSSLDWIERKSLLLSASLDTQAPHTHTPVDMHTCIQRSCCSRPAAPALCMFSRHLRPRSTPSATPACSPLLACLAGEP